MTSGGEVESGYHSAVEAAAIIRREDRRRFVVTGRAPSQMLHGVVTGTIPAGPSVGRSLSEGQGSYSAVLTPKGRLVSDLRIFRMDEGGRPAGPAGKGTLPSGPADGAGERLLLDVPAAGAPALSEHLGRFLPPRFARLREVSDEVAHWTLVGPDAPHLLSRELLGLRIESAEMASWVEDEFRVAEGGEEEIPTLVIRTGDVWPLAYDVMGPVEVVEGFAERLLTAGVAELGEDDWEVLRVEAGRPRFGKDMNDETIPVEAGIDDRAIDHAKGCYTGQEVIVRIRDRGHVNRYLRGLRVLEGEVSEPGVPVWPEDSGDTDRSVGWVTSLVESPREEGLLAMGYVRREVPPGSTVRIGEGRRARAEVVDLKKGWE